jgi:hypothetical protein
MTPIRAVYDERWHVERIGIWEVYKLGFGTRAWCARRAGVQGRPGAIVFSSRREARDYARRVTK